MRSSLSSRRVMAAGVVLCAVACSGVAAAADLTVAPANNGAPANTTQKILNGGDTLTVESGAKLSVSGSNANNSTAVRGGTAGTVTINNNGTIEQTGTVRAIRNQTAGLTFDINNAAGASITSLGDDVFKTNGGYHIDNQGIIWQKGTTPGSGQALDLRDTTAAFNTIVNGSAGNTSAMIRADGDDALRPGANTTITNFGTIVSYGTVNSKCPDYLGAACGSAPSAHDAIDVGGNTNVTVNNYGTISGPRHAITADNEITVTNYASGVIVGRNGSGVGSDGNGTVYNYGVIRGDYAGAGNSYDHLGNGTTTNNGDGDGVDIDKIALIVNYGQITGAGAGGVDNGGLPNGSDGVAAGGGTIINASSGVIRGAQNGILVDDGSGGAGVAATTVTNFGTIEGTTKSGIRIEGAFSNTIDNSGRISGGTEAIRTGSGNDTLTLHAGSTVIGLIELGGGQDTLNYLQSSSAVYTFSNTAPEIVNAPGSVVVVSGSKVALINPSAQAAGVSAFSDLTAGISDMVFGRLESQGTGPQGTGIPSGFAGAMNLGARTSLKGNPGRSLSASAFAAWGNAFGTWTRGDGDGSLSPTSSRVGGFAAGYDRSVGDGLRTGVFLGGAYGSVNVDAAIEKNDATSVYGGLYAQQLLSAVSLDASLTIGASDHESERTVANNMAPAGFETVSSDYWSFFVNPVVGVSSRGGFLGTRLAAAARVGYAGSWSESYTEEGGDAAMSFDNQGLHLFHARAEFKLPVNFQSVDGVAYYVAPFVGVRGYTQVGDTDITGSIVGADFAFDAGSDRSVGSAFAGLNAAVAVGEQGQAFLDVEGGRRTDDTDELKAKAGVRWSW